MSATNDLSKLARQLGRRVLSVGMSAGLVALLATDVALAANSPSLNGVPPAASPEAANRSSIDEAMRAPVLPDLTPPTLGELLLAQDDSGRARRRRRPSFERPGGSRSTDPGAPQESAPVPPSETEAQTPSTPQPAPSTADGGSSEGGSSPVVPAPPPRIETDPSDGGSWTPTPRRRATRPGSTPEAGESDSGDAPERRRPSRRNAPRFENELPDYEFVPLPDRWRIIENLGVNERWYDPYNQNTLKADRPILGTEDWFINLNFIFDSVLEARRIPIPTGAAGDNGQEVDLFGDGVQLETQQTILASVALIQGDTTFRPPDWEFRVTAAANFNYVEVEQLGALKLDPREGDERIDYHFTLQEAFIDKHLWNRTDRFDFDSLRIGIQPFNADFRGFLFESQEPGVRLFGNFFNNRAQYNLAWFGRLNKDTNSGLNDLEAWRDDHTIIANFYYQDFPVLGFNVEALFAANINREGDDRDFDNNKNLVIPAPVGLIGGHDYEVYYVGFGGDGHIERLNLTFQLYGAFGNDDYNSIAQRSQDIQSFFAAFEASYDLDWMRYKAFFLYSMGDDDPYDDTAQGFDTILDNPNFAGGTTSLWQRQGIPFVFGGGVALSGRNSIVPSLRSSKIEGQSNFVNPGLWQVGVGADFDILPELRLLTNVSWLQWDTVQVLEVLRQQDRISREIGWDISAGLIYRPFFTNNIVFRASGAVLIPGSGYEELFEDRSDEPPYSVLLNMTLTY